MKTDEKLYIKSDDVEKVVADYFDSNAIKVEQQQIRRVNIKGNRIYAQVDGDGNIKYAPSHTTVIHTQSKMPQGILIWYANNGAEYCRWFLDRSADYGKYLHAVYARLFKGEKYPFDINLIEEDLKEFCWKNDMDYNDVARWYKKENRDIRKDVYGFLHWVKEKEVKPLAIEVPLFTSEYAGVIDLVCELTWRKKRIKAIVDFKSTLKVIDNYDDYAVQLYSQKKLVEQILQIPIDMLFNFAPRNFRLPVGESVKPYEFKNQTENPVAFKWDHYLAMYQADMPEIELQKTNFTSIDVSLETSLDEVTEDENLEDFILDGTKGEF